MTFDQRILKQIAKKFHLEQILLFGSQSSGQTTLASDFDIGILAKKPLSVKQQDELLIEISQKLNLPIQKIDLTMLNRASPLLLYEAVQNAQLLHGQRDAFDAFKLYAIKRYQDHQKFFNLRHKYLTQHYA